MEYTGFWQPVEAQRKGDPAIGNWPTHALDGGFDAVDGLRIGDPGKTHGDGEEIYEWMPGGYFLVHRWEPAVGARPFRETEIVGYKPARGDYFKRFLDNHSEYRFSGGGGIWTFEEQNTRATVALTDASASLDIAWQWADDGSDWLPVCDLVSRCSECMREAA
jgi:hypothetical protein